MNDLITVIVTIYNREKYLKECLDSVKNQTHTNFECIMVDDGSTDGSIDIAKAYSIIDDRFKLIQSEHVGFSAVKNIGLDNAKGSYIIFLDSDDVVYPCWLELLYEAIINTGADISTCYYDEYVEGKQQRLEEHNSEYYQTNPFYIAEYSFLKMNLIYHRFCSCYLWNKLVKKEIYDNIRFKDQIALSDISEIYKIVDMANKVVQIQTPLIHYRRHIESTGGECGKMGLEYFIFRFNVLEESIKFVWEKYPQSRHAAQLMLYGEIKRMTPYVKKEDFEKYINRPFFKEVLNSKQRKFFFPDIAQQSMTNQHLPPNVN